MKPTPKPARVWELGSDLWLPVGFSEHANLQYLLSRLLGKPENKIGHCTSAPSLLGLRSRKGEWGACPTGKASTRPTRSPDSSHQHFTPTR